MTERIGDFLVRIGAMQLWQVEEVLKAQKAGDDRLFGEIAIEFHYINDEAIKRYVDHQQKRRRASRGARVQPKDEPKTAECQYRQDCHFFNIRNMTPYSKRMRQLYCVEWPEKCAIFQAKSQGKPIPITLWPGGVVKM
jgi:hypothetical protein